MRTLNVLRALSWFGPVGTEQAPAREPHGIWGSQRGMRFSKRFGLTAAVFGMALAGALLADSQPAAVSRDGAAPQWTPLPSPAAVGSMAPQITVDERPHDSELDRRHRPNDGAEVCRAHASRLVSRPGRGVRRPADGQLGRCALGDGARSHVAGCRVAGEKRLATQRRTTSGFPGRQTTDARGRRPSARTTTGRRPSTASCRCSERPAAASVWSGSMAARSASPQAAMSLRAATYAPADRHQRARRWSTRACVIVVPCPRRSPRTA